MKVWYAELEEYSQVCSTKEKAIEAAKKFINEILDPAFEAKIEDIIEDEGEVRVRISYRKFVPSPGVKVSDERVEETYWFYEYEVDGGPIY